MQSKILVLLVVLCSAALGACSSSGDVSIGGGQGNSAGTSDFSIAYIKRPLPTDPAALAKFLASDDLRQQRDFRTGADVYIRDKASPSGNERNITMRVTSGGVWDVRDLDVSADGQKLVFAMRGPLQPNQQEEDAPTWNIWEYDIGTDNLHRVIPDDVIAEDGQDVSPHFLPDGNILFSSTRQREAKAILIDEGKSGFENQVENLNIDESAFVLHKMSPDGTLSGIRQVSFGQSHDIDASVMGNGRILWTRWDSEVGNARGGMNLYTANPDGSDLQLLYGARSHATGTVVNGVASTVQFVKAREMQDGRILAVVRPFAKVDFGGNLITIDVQDYVDNTQLTLAGASSGASATGPAQKAVTPNDVRTVAGPSPGGRFNSAWPLWDNTGRILASWSECRLIDPVSTNIVPCTSARLADPAVQLAPPLYSAWLVNPADGTLQPVVTPTEGVMLTDIVSLQARTAPPYIRDTPVSAELAPDLAVGIVDIRSVYDWDGAVWPGLNAATGNIGITTIEQVAALPAAQRPARFVRVEKAVSIPSDKVLDFNRDLAFGVANGYMREILGYAPIAADGSVRVKVPANVSFNLSVVDANGRRLWAPNRVWQQVRPGEITSCNGCYYNTSATMTHGRPGVFNSVYIGALAGQMCANGERETLAQVASAWGCGTSPYQAPPLSTDLVFDGSASGDTSISLRYADLTTIPPTAPLHTSCSATTTGWNSTCRATINYPTVIRPLWLATRPNGTDGDNLPDTCVSCHNSSPVDANNVVKPPGEQLNLTDDANQATLALQAQRGYNQLTQGFTYATAGGGASANPEPASLFGGSARNSGRFFDIFAPGGSHAGRLSEAELRLVSEWVDIGTQYYNNPFDAPLN